MKKSIGMMAVLAALAAGAAEKERTPDSFNFAFSPSREILRVRHETSNETRGPVAHYRVTDRASGKSVAEWDMDAVKWTSRIVPVKGLDGDYAITMTCGKDTCTKTFERHHFPWEGNTLGKSRTVYPPFTPIAVTAGKTPVLKTVLREHTLGAGGLPAQICAGGKDLLAAPMRFVDDGETLTSDPVRFEEKSPDRVVTVAKLRGSKGFEGTARGIWEEDGCLRYELTLEKGSLGHLTLEVPLKDESATMIHALGVMRATTTAFLGKQQGTLWISKNTPQLLTSFCPYVYLGDAHRGLAWWCEGPNGWVWKNSYSNCAVVRDGAAVTLRVYLVCEPTRITAPQTIVMGFLAAPVKPRPADWLTRVVKDMFQFIATDICWFSESNCGGVQPAGGNLALWDWMADCYLPGRRPDLTKIEEIMKPVDDYVKVYGGEGQMLSGEFRRMMRQHEEWGRGKCVTPMWYFNRSVWNNLPEWKTYMTEWGLQMWNMDWGSPNRGEIYIDPGVESYLDYACWWWKKSFEAGNRGVYCDNYFNMLSWNAFDPGGLNRNVIWSLRAQAKRVRQMMCELKMKPFFWPHMTSEAVLPWLSFADGQLDWEDHLGGGPFQRRFSPEYLMLATSGELAGVIPQILWDRTEKGLATPATRNTFSAAMNILGMTSQKDYDGAEFDHVIRRKFLLDPNVRFINWMDEGPKPVTCDRGNVYWGLWYVPGKGAMLVALPYNGRNPLTAKFTVDYAALGLPKPVLPGVGQREKATADGNAGLGGTGGVDDVSLNDVSPVRCRDYCTDLEQPLGQAGFEVAFGPYGAFAGEFIPTVQKVKTPAAPVGKRKVRAKKVRP